MTRPADLSRELALALTLITLERDRQEQRKAAGRFRHTCADRAPSAMTDAERLTVLAEELGEVAREVLTQDGRRLARDTHGTPQALLAELVQVAAVATAWAEGLILELGIDDATLEAD